MNAHGFIFGPTGSGKSASLTNLICQMLAMYLPRMFEDMLRACSKATGVLSLSIQGWLFESSKCDGRVLVATYHRTGNSTAADLPPERGIPNRSFLSPGPRGVFGIGDDGQRHLVRFVGARC